MNEQDKRAVEGMARCGLDFAALCSAFPKFQAEEIKEVYMEFQNSDYSETIEPDIKCCGSDIW